MQTSQHIVHNYSESLPMLQKRKTSSTPLGHPASAAPLRERAVDSLETTKHEHEWVVFSTALTEVWLMVQCVVCRAMGTVDHPTTAEWAKAFYAPSRPYLWPDASRVTIRHPIFAKPYVVRKCEGPNCSRECPDRRKVGKYERFPGEVIKSRKLTGDDRRELIALADFVANSDLCSHVFPLFMDSVQQHTGNESCGAVRYIANLISAFDHKGLHHRPAIVAAALREFVRFNS